MEDLQGDIRINCRSASEFRVRRKQHRVDRVVAEQRRLLPHGKESRIALRGCIPTSQRLAPRNESALVGAVVATAVLPDSMQARGVILDEPAGLLYVAAELAGEGVVVVYDASSLGLLGVLPTGTICGEFCDATLALDGAQHRLYMNGQNLNGLGGSEQVFIFDLLP